MYRVQLLLEHYAITDGAERVKELGHMNALTSLDLCGFGNISGAGLKDHGHLASLTSL